MDEQCIALYKKLFLVCLLFTFVSCYTIKSSVIDYLDKKWPAKYWYEQQAIKDSINKKEHKSVPLL
jgi:hypothetical protein